MTETTTRPARPKPSRKPPQPISNLFDESIELDDPRPSLTWEPSPAQVWRWAGQIRDENNRRDGIQERSAWDITLEGMSDED